MKCPKCKCYTFDYIQNHKEYLELKCARCGNIFKDYINQPTLSSEVEDDLKTLEDWLYRKKSMYTLDGIVIVNGLRKALSGKDKEIDLGKEVAKKCIGYINQLNAIAEVLDREYKKEGYFSEYTSKINDIIKEEVNEQK